MQSSAASATLLPPSVASVTPVDGSSNVPLTSAVACDVHLPNLGAGIDETSLTSASVFLARTSDGVHVNASLNIDAAGSAIVLQPVAPLQVDTSYTFTITTALHDTSGAAFVPFQLHFTTTAKVVPPPAGVAFDQIALPTASHEPFTGITFGPNGKLYAATEQGDIFQFPVNKDGTLGTPTDIRTVIQSNGGAARLITGITFDPASTATNLIMWVSHGFGSTINVPDWTGKISRLSGPGLSTYQDFVVGLPRSARDHLNNQPVFGPDHALYWGQASETAMGAADSAWGMRPEHLLSAAILRLDTKAVAHRLALGLGPLNVQTENLLAGKKPYNPFALGAPLTLYATGVRNAYDMVWDTNGHLYAPVNGSAAGGNTPASPAAPFHSVNRIDSSVRNYSGPKVPGLQNVSKAEDDWLFDIKAGGYYGHPNPTRSEFVMNGGNPTVSRGANFPVQSAYPKGTNPDPNYRGIAFDFGTHYSPNGVMEYFGNAFHGALNHTLMVTRYSSGDDIVVLHTGSDGRILSQETGIKGFTAFNDPLDICENRPTGFIYIAELGGQKITLLRPSTSAPVAVALQARAKAAMTATPAVSIAPSQVARAAAVSTATPTLYFNDPSGGSPSPTQTITITNTGSTTITVPAGAISVVGTDAALFQLVNQPTLPRDVAPGASFTITLDFNAGGSARGIHMAQLQIKSNDAAHITPAYNLRALTTGGIGGLNEPSLQRILDLYQIPLKDGDSNPADTILDTPPKTPNDEIALQTMVKAGAGPVVITPLAVFSASITPSAGFGFYTPGLASSINQLFYFDSASAQTVNPHAIGPTSFDPGAAVFGVYSSFEAFADPATGTARIAYSQDSMNAWDTKNPRKVRFYPLKNPDGSVVANAYVFATEDYNLQYDSNDVVGIIRNVKPAPSTGALIATQDLNAVPGGSNIVFTKLQNADASAAHVKNIFHNTDTLRIWNTGNQTLNVTSISSSSSAFTASIGSFSVSAGGFKDVTLKYNPTHGGLVFYDAATLTIHSNSVSSPATTLSLFGIWQTYPNQTPSGQYSEPTLQRIIQAFGFGTVITKPGQSLNQGGRIAAVGDEVLSAYWTLADTNLPATVRQLAGFRTDGTVSALYTYPKGFKTSFSQVVRTPGTDAETLLPLSVDATGTPGFNAFKPSGIFGFNVDKQEYSDNALNQKPHPTDQGHHLRFWPAKDSKGTIIPHAYIMAMDYAGINYDYNDNVYLITNIKPA